jgi:rhamnose transport system substrate-binding protein
MAKWLVALIVMLSGVALVGGCQKQSAAPATQAASSAGSGKIQIVFIPKNMGNSYFDLIGTGFKQAASEYQADFTTVAPASDSDPAGQIAFIKDQIQRGVQVIAVIPNSTTALIPVLKQAMDKGITVITLDADLTGNEQYRSAGVWPADADEIGASQVEALGSLMNYSGKFAILSATTEAPNQNAWIKAMKLALQGSKYQNMQLVDIVYGDDKAEKCQTESEALLNKYPDLKGILSPTTVGIVGAARVVQDAGKSGQIVVTGLGLPSLMRGFVKDGVVKKFQFWNGFNQGYLAGQVACQLANKSLHPAAGVTFKAGILGDRTFRDKNVVIADKPADFTADNIDKYNF